MKTYVALLLGVTLFIGCSKNSSPQPQATTTTIATNTLDGLQVENDKQILDIQSKIELLRKTYKVTDQPYLDEQAKLNQKLALQKELVAEIQAMKHQ